LIDVYRFDEMVNSCMAEKVFRKNKSISSGTEIQYVFFRNNLVKVKVKPSELRCTQCSAEYYFSDGKVISKNEERYNQQPYNFIKDAAFFLEDFKSKNK
jgi:hypothetical protein